MSDLYKSLLDGLGFAVAALVILYFGPRKAVAALSTSLSNRFDALTTPTSQVSKAAANGSESITLGLIVDGLHENGKHISRMDETLTCLVASLSTGDHPGSKVVVGRLDEIDRRLAEGDLAMSKPAAAVAAQLKQRLDGHDSFAEQVVKRALPGKRAKLNDDGSWDIETDAGK